MYRHILFSSGVFLFSVLFDAITTVYALGNVANSYEQNVFLPVYQSNAPILANVLAFSIPFIFAFGVIWGVVMAYNKLVMELPPRIFRFTSSLLLFVGLAKIMAGVENTLLAFLGINAQQVLAGIFLKQGSVMYPLLGLIVILVPSYLLSRKLESRL